MKKKSQKKRNTPSGIIHLLLLRLSHHLELLPYVAVAKRLSFCFSVL
ncbi:MAG: hypothetical protein ACLUBZ_13275 [Ruthenibacterium lactatiformans]